MTDPSGPEESEVSPAEPTLDPDQLEEVQRQQRSAWTEGLASWIDQRTDPPNGDDLVRFFTWVLEEGDRAVPIVCFSYLETELETWITRGFLNSEYSGRLFRAFGPLSTADARVEISYALGWIDENLRDDLRIHKWIRNLFAHNFIDVGLEDPRVKEKLSGHHGLNAWQPTEKATSGTTRGLYLWAFADTAWRLLGHLFVLPAVTKFMVVETERLMKLDGDLRPQVLRDLDQSFYGMVYLLMLTHGNDEGRGLATHRIKEIAGMDIEEPLNPADFLRMLREDEPDRED